LPLITKEKVKSLTSLTDADDKAIEEVIPGIQDYILRYTRNSFVLPKTRVQNTEIKFFSGDKKISCQSCDFIASGFKGASDIVVKNSISNDGIYAVVSVSKSEIVLEDNINDEDSGERVEIARIKFPVGLEKPAADLVEYHIQKKPAIVKGEKTGSYSFQYGFEFPDKLLAPIRVYRRIQFA